MEKDQDAPLIVPTLALHARQRDSWLMQCNFDVPRCGDWVLTLALWQEGAHEDRDSRRKPQAGFNDFIMQMSVRGPRTPAKVQFLQAWENNPLPRSPKVEYLRGPRFSIWLLSESSMVLLGFACPSHEESSPPATVPSKAFINLAMLVILCGCMGCVK